MSNGVVMNRGFDADGRTVSLSYATSAGVMRLRHTLTFDKVGNVLSQRELDGALTSFTYDVLDQLLTEQRSGSHAYKRLYSYDSAGNRLTLNADGVATTSTYDAVNQLKTAQTGVPVTTFSYDGAGNRVGENAAGALTTFLFNQDNKLVGAALPDGTRPGWRTPAIGLPASARSAVARGFPIESAKISTVFPLREAASASYKAV